MYSDLNEIRINASYASKLLSDYPNDSDKESVPKVRIKNLRTETFISKIINQISPQGNNDMMPLNCRFIKKYSTYTLVVIEEQPAVRSIRVSMDMDKDATKLKGKGKWEEFGYKNFFTENSKPYTFMLAMPYVIHVFLFASNNQLSRGKVYFRPRSLLGMGDLMYVPPLLNVSGDMGVCYGETALAGSPRNLTKATEIVIKSFWSSTFNTDYTENYSKYSGVPGVCEYFTWQYYSHVDPMFIYNVDWIPSFKKLGDIIATMQSRSKLADQTLKFKTLYDIFQKPTDSGKSFTPPRTRLEKPLLYDICDGWVAEKELVVNVGDPLNYSKGRIAYVDSFIGIQGALQPFFIQLEIDGKLTVMKINKRVTKFIADKIKELRYEAQLETPNGMIIKANDILNIETRYGDTFKKVHYIRKAIDGKIEIRLGSDFCFADSFDWSKVKKVDLEKPEINGQVIDFGTTYKYLTGLYYNQTPISKVVDVNFDEITTGARGHLVAKFVHTESSKTYSIDLSSKKYDMKRLYPVDEVEELPYVFFVGRTLSSVRLQSSPSRAYKHKDLGVIFQTSNSRGAPSYTDTIKEFISDNGKHFHAESFNLELDFHIGDKVIVADWRNPLEICRIKTIQGFTLNDNSQTIDFVLTDKHDKITSHRYVDVNSSFINIGKIRKVTNKIDRVTSGTKIIAKEAGITCFPKKNVNIIVAFVIDTGGEPLVLCSNGCTLWYTDMMEKFNRVTIKSKKYATLPHAPLDPSKIKLQAGDIVNGTYSFQTMHGYLIARNRGNTGSKAIQLPYYLDYDDYYSLDARFKSEVVLDCIPNPRMTLTQQKQQGFVAGFSNFHGGVSPTHKNHSPYKFIDDTRRF